MRIALYGLENQTDIDHDMSLRLFSYDGTAYRAQLLTDKEIREKSGKTAPRYPVVTLVLYFGCDRHWKTPKTFYECLDIPEELKPFVNDYRMNLFEIVADYFVQIRRNGDYLAPQTTINYVHELL